MKYDINCYKKWLSIFGVEYLLEEVAPENTVITDGNQESHSTLQQTSSPRNTQSDQIHYKTIEDLRNAVMQLYHPLKDTCKNTVFSSGPCNSRLMIIGEAPGADEDEQGIPFVGESGKLVNNILKAVGMTRDSVYVTNVFFWRPPKNRPPIHEEVEFARPYFTEHIRLIDPKVIILLGAVATKALLQKQSGITSLRGTIHKIHNAFAIPTFHPSYLLRTPTKKYEAMLDFNLAKRYLQE